MKKSELKNLIKEALEAETLEMKEPYNEIGEIILVMKPKRGMSMDDMVRPASIYDQIDMNEIAGAYTSNNKSAARKAAKLAMKEYEMQKEALKREMEEYRTAKKEIEEKKSKAKELIMKLK
jgi:formaldehyde-activating enzyme involved in methanogenesis